MYVVSFSTELIRLFAQVPGGWAAQRWGGQRTLALSFGLWSTASILTPTDARKTQAIIIARVLVGVAQGLVIPSIHTVLSQVDLLVVFHGFQFVL